MLVLFKDNYECVIKNTATLRVGDMLCELLNFNMFDLEFLELELNQLLKSIDLSSTENKELCEDTVSTCSAFLDSKIKQIEPFKIKLAKLPFYKYTKDVDNVFNLLYEFIDAIRNQLNHCNPDIYFIDAQISYDINLYKEAFAQILAIIGTAYKCKIFFTQVTNDCLLYDSVKEKPIKRLQKYGLDKFNEEASMAIKYTRAIELSPLSLLYEISGDDDNPVLLECFDFTTLPQFIYHEFMKMISLNLHVRKCKNCNKYFVIYGERILEYCSNIPEGETKPCSIVGPARLYEKKVKNDPILEIYTRAYKKYVARKRSGSITPEEFKSWTVKAKELREKAYSENTSPEIFAEWMQ